MAIRVQGGAAAVRTLGADRTDRFRTGHCNFDCSHSGWGDLALEANPAPSRTQQLEVAANWGETLSVSLQVLCLGLNDAARSWEPSCADPENP